MNYQMLAWCQNREDDKDNAPACSLEPGHEGPCGAMDGFAVVVHARGMQVVGRMLFATEELAWAWVEQCLEAGRFMFGADQTGPRRVMTLPKQEPAFVMVKGWADHVRAQERALMEQQSALQQAIAQQQAQPSQFGRPAAGPRPIR